MPGLNNLLASQRVTEKAEVDAANKLAMLVRMGGILGAIVQTYFGVAGRAFNPSKSKQDKRDGKKVRPVYQRFGAMDAILGSISFWLRFAISELTKAGEKNENGKRKMHPAVSILLRVPLYLINIPFNITRAVVGAAVTLVAIPFIATVIRIRDAHRKRALAAKIKKLKLSGNVNPNVQLDDSNPGAALSLTSPATGHLNAATAQQKMHDVSSIFAGLGVDLGTVVKSAAALAGTQEAAALIRSLHLVHPTASAAQQGKGAASALMDATEIDDESHDDCGGRMSLSRSSTGSN